MPGRSSIEWTDATWNPSTGCTRISDGCDHCYIERSTPFRVQGRKFELVGKQETTGIRLHEDRLKWPFSREARRLCEELGRPARVFVNSLSDLFHEDIPPDFVWKVFGVMAEADHLVFQILTKRPRHALYLAENRKASPEEVDDGYELGVVPGLWEGRGDLHPLPNVWMGVSIESWRFNWRADVLRRIPAAVRFISAEPLLGRLLEPVAPRSRQPERTGEPDDAATEGAAISARDRALDLSDIDWLIAGGESGGRFARPMHPEWARELRDACAAAGTAFFFKQQGSWRPAAAGDIAHGATYAGLAADGSPLTLAEAVDAPGAAHMVYAGANAKSGGKVLDGREWCDFPAAELAGVAA